MRARTPIAFCFLAACGGGDNPDLLDAGVDAFVAIDGDQDGLVAVTWLPDWLIVALQPWVTRWLPGKAQVTDQPPEIGSPRLVTLTVPVNPVLHWFTV